MASQSRMNAYMERHRLGPLFEDLMNKVLRDMPEEPMVYLLRAMYKKAGMEIPQGIRYGGVRKSTSDLPRNSSPERQSRSVDMGGSRDYERPWATSPTRRLKPRKGDNTGVSKSKPEWNPDVKSKALDQLWEDGDSSPEKAPALRKSASKKSSNAVNAWATVGLGDEGESYSSPPYRGHRQGSSNVRMSESDLLAAETMPVSRRFEPQTPVSALTANSSRFSRGPKEEAKRQRARMGQMYSELEHQSDDSGVDFSSKQPDEDRDAIELLEDADDLRNEGVSNIPKSGYKLSKAARYRKNEPRVKLNINTYPYQSDWMDDPPSGFTSVRSSPEDKRWDEDEEEFESVSQVSGPRQPVWHRADSEADLNPLSPNYARQAANFSDHRQTRFTAKPALSPVPSDHQTRSVASTEDLSGPSKPWVAEGNRVSFEEEADPISVRSQSTSGGWRLPDDSDIASVRDWNKRVKGGPSMDPKAY